ncbi:MAG: hypothetical protein ACTJFN_07190 [Sphingobacterium sp.]
MELRNNNILVHRIMAFLCIALLLISCEREFDSNPDFKLNEPAEVFADNNLLFNKIFQFSSGGTYLWFDIRNEVANFSKPFLNLTFVLNPEADPNDQILTVKRIDLRGRLYVYDSANAELTVLDYPLDIATGQEIPADIIYDFGRKQKQGCDLLTDPAQRRTCERSFTLRLKRVIFKDIDFTLEAGVSGTYGNKTIKLSPMSYELILTN